MRVWCLWIAVFVLFPIPRGARAEVGGARRSVWELTPAPPSLRPAWTSSRVLGSIQAAVDAHRLRAVGAPISASFDDEAVDEDCDARAAPATAAQAVALTELRLSQLAARRTAGFWLLGFGVVSAAAGGGLIAFGHDQQALLAAGITTVSFGVINAVLSLGLLDLSHTHQRRILAESTHAQADWGELREAELVAQLQSGQFFALNTGLDVAYLTAGGLLCALAAVRGGADRWELGSGLAVISQSLFLLAFDLIQWIDTSGRVTALRAL